MKVDSSIFCDLNILLFDVISWADDHYQFAAISDLPEWASQFINQSEPDNIPLLEIFPFLSSFMPEACQYWDTQIKDRTTSGVWTEVDDTSRQHQFEAQAIITGQKRVLALINLSESFNERQHIYQKAREIALANEKLTLQLNQHQRQLHREIEDKLSGNTSIEQINKAIEANASAVMVCKPDGGVEIVNQALMDIYQLDEDSQPGTSLLKKWLKEANEIYPEIYRVVESGGFWEGDFESRGDDGKKRWIRLAIGPVVQEEGKIAHFVCIANDLSELRKSSQEVEKLTDYDLTTQLPNRRYFWKRLTKLLDDCVSKQRSIALVYVDLDHFKRVNDGLGHHAGDFLLSTIASRLSRSIKKGDFIAHLGGDEFALIIRLSQPTIDLSVIAKRLMRVINKPIFIENTSVTVNASVGIAIHPQDGKNATSLMKHADLAMYHAKRMGRNQFQIYSSTLDDHFISRFRIEALLSQAIKKDQFRLLYQPQISLTAESNLRMEALLRWHHPEEGLIPPAKFIPIAEENGSIIGIGEWVLRTACKQAKQLLDEHHDITMSVNVSAKQIKDLSFGSYVDRVLEETGLPPKHLELEITETTVMENMHHVIPILARLRASGVAISLDDFGSGFSSLNYLKNLPVDNLKLDRSFIHELPHSDEGKAITSSIISLAHDLAMKVIAEGIETRQQLELLTEQGCDYIQGYYYYHPLEAEKIREILLAKSSQNGSNMF